jgi:aminoglycoside/choline kinase family phosphotransferase
MPERIKEISRWLRQHSNEPEIELRPLAGDASFRRYFRAELEGVSRVIMDAPPDKEDSRPFVEVAGRLRQAGLNAPEILAADARQGFYLLSDLGDDLYLPHLSAERVDRLYGDALAALAVMQATVSPAGLPPYDHALLHREMDLFPDWLLHRHLRFQLSEAERTQLQATFRLLSAAALAQPQVFAHRDYHSRNLMLLPRHNPGIIDFQDAVHGAVTYDLVSLLRDCYIVWPRPQVEAWALGYADLAAQHGIIPKIEDTEFLRWFDWMGLQRHTKVAGIFARLFHRDGKAGYLRDIPTALRYIVEAAASYPETRWLADFTQDRVLPAMLRSLEEGE